MSDIRVDLHKAAFGPAHERSTVLLCAAIDEIEQLRAVVADMLEGLTYLRITNRVPYGFGIDRLEQNGRAALNTARALSTSNHAEPK